MGAESSADEIDRLVAMRTRHLAEANEVLRREVAEHREARERSEVSAQAAINGIPGLVAILNADGTIAALNQQTIAYCGKSLAEFDQWRSNDLVHPDDLTHMAEVMTKSIAAGVPYETELRLRRRDGEYRWFQNRGVPVRDDAAEILRWYVLLTDIDERKRGEQALSDSERDLRLMVDNIPACASLMAANGQVEVVNRQLLDYFGKSTEDVKNWGSSDVLHPEDHTAVTTAFVHSITTGAPFDVEQRLLRHDGVYRWFHVRGLPLRDENGAIARWYVLHIDVDERKRAEEALAKLRSELEHVSRVSSLGAMTASIAHEVNQPLSGIITNANTCLRMLAADPPNIEGALETARRTIRDGNRASEVVTRLRALFRKKDFSAEAFDLNEAAREVVALTTPELQRSRTAVSAQLHAGLPFAMGDRVQIQQVILNLLLNAADAMRTVDRSRQIIIKTSAADGAHALLEVEDSGVGLDPSALNLVFESFYTTKPEGMGIGLAVSRSIIERHQGKLWASQNQGYGATFSFLIPTEA